MVFEQEVSTICNVNPHLNLQFYNIKAYVCEDPILLDLLSQ